MSKAFYQHLAAGLTKDAALRQAKLDYLNEEMRRNAQVHPYFWAAPLLYGTTNVVEISDSNWLFWLSIITILGLFAFISFQFNFFHYFCKNLRVKFYVK